MDRCDRCAVADKTVTLTDFCPICQSVLLCAACEALHRDEIRQAVDW
jgi:hypothetical protein